MKTHSITRSLMTFAAFAAFSFITAPFTLAEEAAASPLKVGPFSFTVAAPWKQSETPKPMSQGTIELPGKDGAPALTAAFYHFGPGQGGDLKGNIERWKGMFKPEPAAKTEQEDLAFGKEKAVLITITGTYAGSRFSPEKEPRADYTLLAAVLPSAEGDVYVRFVGPAAGIAASKEEFKKLLLSAAK